MRKKEHGEYAEFEKLTDRLLSVPHDKVKEKLETEKRSKKRKKAKPSSASREESDRA